MTCDRQDQNGDRRRDLLQQLKCLIVSMERRYNNCHFVSNQKNQTKK